MRLYSTVATVASAPLPSLARLQVGKIVACARHADADTLYVLQVDVGGHTLQVCSGLVPYMAREALLDQHVTVVANMKPSKMRGVRSEAMLLAAEKRVGDAVAVRLVRPPSSSAVGELLFFGSHRGASAARLKSSVWREIEAHLRTDADGVVAYGDAALRTPPGDVATAELADAKVR